MAKLIIVMADLQVPYHDPAYIRVMAKFVRAQRGCGVYRNVQVGQIGDLMDQPEVGRWNKGAAGEYAGTFWAGVRETRQIIDQFQFDWIKIGNHDRRVEDYITKYAPALGGDDSEWNIDSLLRIDTRKTKIHRRPFLMSPGWTAAHGDEARSTSQIAGQTAFKLTSRWDTSVVCGHTHRAGTVSKTIGMGAENRRRITGMEVGNGMLEEYATYIPDGAPNWQKAFGAFVVDRGRTYDHLVMMDADCSFEWNGRIYRP
jgi:hypothetical protein